MKDSKGYSIDLDEEFKDGRTRYYRYSDPDFSINNMPLNEIEVDNLKSAIELLSQFKGMPQFEWMNETISKLQQNIKPAKQKEIMSFDANQYLKGIEWLGELYNSIQYKKVLTITYQDFNAPDPYELEFHPYYLKQYNNRWFVFGYNPAKDIPTWNLALDRIKDIKQVKGKYRPDQTNWDEYFDDIIGVTIPENKKVEKVELSIASNTAKYILSKPLHHSQTQIKMLDSDQVHIVLKVMVNRELINTILSFGDNITVLKPAGLRKEISSIFATALTNYN
ncbi:MAG: WYL domain-containing protein [Bacteroidetes bacterium]|nr:WYL domain-containing protein [Bacteroidota bacterium]